MMIIDIEDVLLCPFVLRDKERRADSCFVGSQSCGIISRSIPGISHMSQRNQQHSRDVMLCVISFPGGSFVASKRSCREIQ